METYLPKIGMLLIMTFLTSCSMFTPKEDNMKSKSQMEWKFVNFYDIELGSDKDKDQLPDPIDNYNFKQILPYNKDIFFLLGDNSNSIEGIVNPSSVIYRSMDSGTTFTKTSLGEGTITEGGFVKETLYIVLQNKVFENNKPIINTTVYQSKDFGETWEKIAFFENTEIDKIYFYTEKIGIARFYDRTNETSQYKYTSDGGVSWHTAKGLIKTEYDPLANGWFKSENEIYYMTDNGFLKSFNLTKEDSFQVVKKIATSTDIEGYSYINMDEKSKEPFVVCYKRGSQGAKGFLYYLNTEEKVPFENGWGVVYGNMMYEYMYDPENVFVSYYRFSYDRGKTWTVEELTDFYLPAFPKFAYAEDGYIFLLATLYKKRMGVIAIGHPK